VSTCTRPNRVFYRIVSAVPAQSSLSSECILKAAKHNAGCLYKTRSLRNYVTTFAGIITNNTYPKFNYKKLSKHFNAVLICNIIQKMAVIFISVKISFFELSHY